MLKKRVFTYGSFILMFGLFILISNQVHATDPTPLRKVDTKRFLFAIPNGGWENVTVEAQYSERYHKNGSKNTFYQRDKVLLYKAVGVGSPGVSALNVKHSNGRAFTSWHIVDSIYGSEWDYGFDLQNNESVTYGNHDGITANFPYNVSCMDAIPALHTGSIKLSLNTK